jgi:hypothetical protein
MMSKITFAAPVLVGLLGLGCGVAAPSMAAEVYAQAAPSAWEIDSRIRQSHERINKNLERGALTIHEAKRLRGELDSIRDTEARMRRDGRLDHREREILDHKLDRLNEEISVEKRR